MTAAAPYTEVNEAWVRYERGWWVLDVPTGRVGLVRKRFRSPVAPGDQYEVQFGADGPAQIRMHTQLLLATKTQVETMEGVHPR